MEKDIGIWKILNFDKGDIFTYLVFGVGIVYVWKISDISSMYILPIVLLGIFIYLRQDYLHRINIELDHKLNEIKLNLLQNKYLNMSKDNKMLMFLDSIAIYKKYSPRVFFEFLDVCERYYLKPDIYNFIDCVDKFESFNHLIPIQMLKSHFYFKKEMVNIIKKILKEPKRKMVEMQSFIPFNLTSNNFYSIGKY